MQAILLGRLLLVIIISVLAGILYYKHAYLPSKEREKLKEKEAKRRMTVAILERLTL
jgi:hypothetical protein